MNTTSTRGGTIGARLLLALGLLSLAVALALPPLALGLAGWQGCARAALSSSSMVPVNGRLDGIVIPRKYRIGVSFSYRFGGRDYVGTHGTFCSGLTTRSQIDPLDEMYRQLLPLAGKPVTVWVDPARPENAVLYRYTPRAAILIFGLVPPILLAVMVNLYLNLARRLRARFLGIGHVDAP